MKTSFQSALVGFFLLFSTLGFSQVYKHIGNAQIEGGDCIIEHPTNSNFLIGGTSNGEAAIYELTTAGVVVNTWTFDIKAGIKDRITRLVVDSQGDILGVGYCGVSVGQYDGFVFRWDVSAQSLMWQMETTTAAMEDIRYFEVHDLAAQDEVLVTMSIRDRNDATNTKAEAAIIRYDRSTGAEIVGSLRQYTNNLVTDQDDGFYASEMRNGHLFISGRGKMASPGQGDSRPTLVEIDITGTYGNVVRSDYYVENMTTNGEMRARDFIFRNSFTTILAGIDGPINGTGGGNNQFILLEKTLGSTANTHRRYSISGASSLYVECIKEVSGGVVIYFRDRNNHSLVFTRFNISGSSYTIAWSKRLTGITSAGITLPGRKSGMHISGNSIFFVAEGTVSGNTDLIFGEMDLATGNITGIDGCIADAPVTFIDSWSFEQSFTYGDPNLPHTTGSASPAVATPTMTETDLCQNSPDPCEYDAEAVITQNSDCEFSFSVIFNTPPPNTVYYEWDFGDGTTSNDPNPTHQYFTAGIFFPSLTLYTYHWDGSQWICCEKQIDLDPIEVQEPCDPCPRGTIGMQVKEVCCNHFQFTATGINHATMVFWDFGDGTTGTGSPIEHTYPAPGSYTVTLTTMYYDDEVCCVEQVQQQVDVNCDSSTPKAQEEEEGYLHIIESEQNENAQPSSENNSLRLYPNPTGNSAKVAVQNGNIEWVQVIDLSGKVLLEYDGEGSALMQLDLSDLPPGLYQVGVKTDQGTQFGKLMKNE